MKGFRQALVGVIMALMFCVMFLGSASLAMTESGYALAQAPTAAATLLSFPGKPVLTLANAVANQLTPTPIAGQPQAALTFTPPADCLPPKGWQPVMVQPDDTLRGLARSYNTSVDALKAGNCLLTSALIPGTFLYLPPLPPKPPTPQCGPPAGWVVYRARPGDTLSRLSSTLGVSIWQLQSANCLGSSTYIWTGQSLYVPFYPPVYATPYPTATRWLSPTPWPPTATRPATLPPTVTTPPTWTLSPSLTPTQGVETPTATSPGGVTDTPPPTDTVPPPTVPPPTDTPLPPPTATSVPPTVPPPPTLPPPTVPPPPTSEPPTPTAFPYP